MKRKRYAQWAALGLLTLLAASCSSWFEEKIPLDRKNDSGNLSDLLVSREKETKLFPPADVFASQGLYSGSILVSWRAVQDAASYRLERAEAKKEADGTWKAPDAGQFSVVKEFTTKTSYLDVIVAEPGSADAAYEKRYYYRVLAENTAEDYDASEFTKPLPDANGAGWLFAPPKNLSADKGASQESINVSWEPADGAAFYLLYRDTRKDFSSATLVARVRGNRTSYRQTVSKQDQGMDFYYKVCAENRAGNRSALTLGATGYALKEGAPPAPANVTVVNGLGTSKKKITVKWDAVTPAPDTTVTYTIYRTSSADAVVALVKRDVPVTTTQYEDKNGLKPGVMYYYYLLATAKKTSGEVLKSAYSDSGKESKKPAFGFLLSPPDEVIVTDASDKNAAHADVLWPPAVGSGVKGLSYTYRVYGSDTPDGAYTEVAGAKGVLEEGGKLFRAKNIAKKNYYRVATVNAAGIDKESEKSEAAAPVPLAPKNVAASKTKKLSKDFAPNSFGVYPVEVTWAAPDGGAAGGYHVFRSEQAAEGFRKLTESPVSELRFIDKNESAKPEKYYYYKVVALNSLGQGTKGNNPAADAAHDARGYGALSREAWFKAYNKTIKKSLTKLVNKDKGSYSDKLAAEERAGDVSGKVNYSGSVSGFGAEIKIHYTDYADFYDGIDKAGGRLFILNGDSNISVNAGSNGTMSGTVTCTGMYPGVVGYGGIEIKGGAAGGGTYSVQVNDLSGAEVLPAGNVSWTLGDEK